MTDILKMWSDIITNNLLFLPCYIKRVIPLSPAQTLTSKSFIPPTCIVSKYSSPCWTTDVQVLFRAIELYFAPEYRGKYFSKRKSVQEDIIFCVLLSSVLASNRVLKVIRNFWVLRHTNLLGVRPINILGVRPINLLGIRHRNLLGERHIILLGVRYINLLGVRHINQQLLNIPSGSSNLGIPSSVSAIVKASSRFSRLDLPFTLSKSTSSGRIAWMTEWKATPLLQLRPKSFTSIPVCLHVKKDKIMSHSKEMIGVFLKASRRVQSFPARNEVQLALSLNQFWAHLNRTIFLDSKKIRCRNSGSIRKVFYIKIFSNWDIQFKAHFKRKSILRKLSGQIFRKRKIRKTLKMIIIHHYIFFGKIPNTSLMIMMSKLCYTHTGYNGHNRW